MMNNRVESYMSSTIQAELNIMSNNHMTKKKKL